MSHSDYTRILAVDRFESALRRAWISRLWDRLTIRRTTLLSIDSTSGELIFPGGIYQGIQLLPVSQILGSLSRAAEFDHRFRTLHKNQRKRWTNMWALRAQGGWEPIIVHQIGDMYFVEDGHHRVSVDRGLGLETIEAAVTAYTVTISMDQNETLEDALLSATRS